MEKQLQKNNVKLFNDRSILKNTSHVNFNDKSFDNVRFVKVNSLSDVNQYLTLNQYVDDAIDEFTLVRTCRHSDFKNKELSNLWNFLIHLIYKNPNYDAIRYDHAARKKLFDYFIDESSLSD